MTTREVVRDIVQLQRTVSQINDEIPDAGITLTRTTAQAITTAGTTIVWQSRIRGQGMTWSGASVTIPSDGWYIVSVATQLSASINDLIYRLNVNAANVQSRSAIGDIDRTNTSVVFMRYFTSGDTVQINMIPSANVNVNVNVEGTGLESPILHIVQLTNQAEV